MRTVKQEVSTKYALKIYKGIFEMYFIIESILTKDLSFCSPKALFIKLCVKMGDYGEVELGRESEISVALEDLYEGEGSELEEGTNMQAKYAGNIV